jgi:hypothetical protein
MAGFTTQGGTRLSSGWQARAFLTRRVRAIPPTLQDYRRMFRKAFYHEAYKKVLDNSVLGLLEQFPREIVDNVWRCWIENNRAAKETCWVFKFDENANTVLTGAPNWSFRKEKELDPQGDHFITDITGLLQQHPKYTKQIWDVVFQGDRRHLKLGEDSIGQLSVFLRSDYSGRAHCKWLEIQVGKCIPVKIRVENMDDPILQTLYSLKRIEEVRFYVAIYKEPATDEELLCMWARATDVVQFLRHFERIDSIHIARRIVAPDSPPTRPQSCFLSVWPYFKDIWAHNRPPPNDPLACDAIDRHVFLLSVLVLPILNLRYQTSVGKITFEGGLPMEIVERVLTDYPPVLRTTGWVFPFHNDLRQRKPRERIAEELNEAIRELPRLLEAVQFAETPGNTCRIREYAAATRHTSARNVFSQDSSIMLRHEAGGP